VKPRIPPPAPGAGRHSAASLTLRRQVRTPARSKTPGSPRLAGPSDATLWARTANPDSQPVASEVSRGAPPYQYSSRKDPDRLIFRVFASIHLPNLTVYFINLPTIIV
jgi:hypothetical protein